MSRHVEVELLHFDGCPNSGLARERIEKALRAERLEGSIVEHLVEDQASALAARFLGSPSIRINGLDVEPEARDRVGYGLACRTYQNDSTQEGAPATAVIRAALQEAVGR
jgi:hypothetical protein